MSKVEEVLVNSNKTWRKIESTFKTTYIIGEVKVELVENRMTIHSSEGYYTEKVNDRSLNYLRGVLKYDA